MMKRTLLSILFGACSLFALSQGAAVAGVEKNASVWLLTPASWHPNPNKLHENYPWDLGEGAQNELHQQPHDKVSKDGDANSQAKAEYHQS